MSYLLIELLLQALVSLLTSYLFALMLSLFILLFRTYEMSYRDPCDSMTTLGLDCDPDSAEILQYSHTSGLVRICASYNSIVLGFMLLRWFRLFDRTASFISLLMEVLK